MYAYDKTYLEKARTALGRMLDFAVYDLKYNIEDFFFDWDLFDASSALQMDFRKNVLEKDELLVYSLLDFCPVGIGTLCDKSSLPILTLFEILERLQQKGFVKEIIPNYFVQTV